MFSFINDMGNYEDRKVDAYDTDTLYVSTARVYDGEQPFETAVGHQDYNGGALIIVEAYDTRELAIEGHAKWLKIMSAEQLPDTLIDCQNDKLSKVLSKEDLTFHRTKR